jgi:hypothetical protein
MADVLALNVDTVEPRISQDRLLFLRTGQNWDTKTLNNIFIEPESQTAMLLPLPMTPTWQTSAAGNYYRLRKEDYALTTASKWTNHDLKFTGDTYLHCNDPALEIVQTLASYDKNQAVFFSIFGFSDGNSNRKVFECGWGTYNATAANRDLSLRIWSNGNCEVWRGATYIGTMRLTTQSKNKQTPANNAQQGAPVVQVANDRLDICAIPYKRRDLCIVTNYGSDTLTFDDLEEDEPNNTIARAGTFWWYVPSGTAQVQFAPLRYVTGGNFNTESYQFSQPPANGATPSFRSWYDAPTGTSGTAWIVLPDPVGALWFDFNADGILDKARIRVALAGNGKVTPFYYASVVTFEPVTANTANDPTSLINYTTAASLSVGESPSDVKMSLTLKSPTALSAAGMTKSDIISNRPFEAKIGTIAFLTGRTNTPKKNLRISDEATQLTLECQDRWKALEKYLIREAHPLDTMELTDAFEYLAGMPGYPATDMDVEDFDFTIENMGDSCRNDWTAMMQPGDTPAKWLLQLQESYCADTVMGWVPTATGPKFNVKSIDALNAIAAVKTLYPSDADAQSGGESAGAWETFYRTFNEERFEIEANEVYIVWHDPKTKAINRAQIFDRDSQDPITVVDSRPDNWVGEPRLYGMEEPKLIKNASMAAWGAKRMMKLLSEQTRMAEWDAEFQIKTDGSPVWKGDVVALYGKGLYRITTLKCDFKLEDSNRIWRPTHYTGVYVGEIPAS